jgi:hypothetical protein
MSGRAVARGHRSQEGIMHKLMLPGRRPQALAVTLALFAVSLILTAPQASANQASGNGNSACHYDGVTYYACLEQFQYIGYLWYNGSSFLHVNLPEQYAREIVGCPGENFHASLWGNDGGPGADSEDDFIRNLVVAPGWPQANYSGLEVHFYMSDIYYTALDEDDGADELYVRMSYTDCHNRFTYSFNSDNIVGEF